MPSARSMGISFSTENLSPWDSQGRPSFQLLQDSFSQSLPTYFYAFDLLHRNGKLLLSWRLSAGWISPSQHSPLVAATTADTLLKR